MSRIHPACKQDKRVIACRTSPLRVLLAGICLSLALALPAGAAEWPTRALTLVVPYTPGSLTDIIARALTARLGQSLGQPVTIEYRPGGGTAIGTRVVTQGPADGYLMVMQGASTVAVANLLNPNAGYQIEELDSVASVGYSPLAMVITPGLAAKNVTDLIALARSKPGGLTYASAGNGGVGHLAVAYFSTMTGLTPQNLIMVPYKGSADAVLDLMAGRVDMQISVLASSLPAIRSGKLRILAVASAKRQPVLPDVPTIMEAGVPGYEVTSTLGMLVRRGTPTENIRTLNRAFNVVLAEPEVKASLAKNGIAAADSNPPNAFGDEIRGELKKYGPVIREYGIKAE